MSSCGAWRGPRVLRAVTPMRHDAGMAATVVAFHAHPDDEVLYTGGTLALAARAGHRVVLVTATSGEAGLTSGRVRAGGDLGAVRSGELHASAAALGVHRVVQLGFADSGLDGTAAGASGFCHQDPGEVAAQLEEVLAQERPDVLCVYDAAGGYGHPDHRQVHVAGVLAGARAKVPWVMQATVERERLRRALGVVGRLPGLPYGFHPDAVAGAYSARQDITHVVDVRAALGAKRAAMVAHVSQAAADGSARTLDILRRLPGPLFAAVMGTEWFVAHEAGTAPVGAVAPGPFTPARRARR